MVFHVELTGEAHADAEEILEWLVSQEAGETGLRWFQGLKEAIDSLAVMPKRCPLAPENEEFAFEVRQLLYGRKPHIYRVIFTVDDDTVRILRVRHGRRRPLTH